MRQKEWKEEVREMVQEAKCVERGKRGVAENEELVMYCLVFV